MHGQHQTNYIDSDMMDCSGLSVPVRAVSSLCSTDWSSTPTIFLKEASKAAEETLDCCKGTRELVAKGSPCF